MSGLHAWLDAWAASQPGVAAAEDEHGSWTYKELQEASQRAAAFLHSHGVAGQPAPDWSARPQAPRPVALLMRRDRTWFSLCFGSWRMGVPVLSLSEDMPDKAAERARAEQSTRDLRPLAAVLSGDQELPGLPVDCVLIRVAQAYAAVHGPLAANGGGQAHGGGSEVGPAPTSVLVYSYTGGTTKHSKCVVVTHAMAMWEMEHYATALSGAVTSSDRVLQYTSSYWGASCFGQTDIALAFGACAVFVPSAPGLDWLAHAIKAYNITVLGTVPSQLRGAYPGGPRTSPACLRVVITWGEKLPTKLSKVWQEKCSVFELLIASEYWLSLSSDCRTWRDAVDGQEKHVLRALAQLDWLLLDEAGEPVPEGQVGELYLSGPTVSPGYLGHDGRVGTGKENEAAYSLRFGKPYFRTRDRLRCLPGRELVYCGRADSLAKRGGAWMDLEAVEAKVAAVPGVGAAAVLAGDEVDVFLTVEPDQVPSQPMCPVLEQARRAAGGACRLHVKSHLPPHPATGKLDRRRLQAEVRAVREREVEHLARLAQVQRRMLLGYGSWYAPALLCVAGPSLVLCRAAAEAAAALAQRLVVLPYLWAALMFTAFHPRREKQFYAWPVGPPDIVLLLAAVLPSFSLSAGAAAALAVLAHARDRDAPAALGLGLWSLALLSNAVFEVLHSQGAALLLTFALAAALSPGRRGFILGLPCCFYIALAKWMSDDWHWRLRCPESWFRRLLCRFLVAYPRLPWDASLAWDALRTEAYWGGNNVRPEVRVKTACRRMAFSVDFNREVGLWTWWDYGKTGDDSKTAEADADVAAGQAEDGLAGSALAALVERAGGSPQALGALDSLQAITLAELIRQEMGAAVSVASVLQCGDLRQLAAMVEAGDRSSGKAAALTGGTPAASSRRSDPGHPDADGAYRVFMLAFPRHPVDWCIRYTGPRHLDVSALQRAADRLVARHSALRTTQSPDDPMRELMDKVAALWQLWTSCLGSNCWCWHTIARSVGAALFACWPRTVLRAPMAARATIKTPAGPRVRDERWDCEEHDDYVHSSIRELVGDHRWPFDIAVVPLYYGVPEGCESCTAVQAALSLPPEEVAWYIYFGITHAYSDGASAQSLFGDLFRFYEEETGQAVPQLRAEAPEHLSLLQRRLRRSLLGRLPGAPGDANNDVFHEYICDDWGKRPGMSSRLFLGQRLMRSLRTAASQGLGCGVDVAWLTAVVGTMLRLFPELPSVHLMLKVPCRDGPGEVQMVGFLSEQRIVAVDVGDPETATLLDVANIIGAARRARAWRAPAPFESGLCVYVNIVPAMIDGLPEGYRHVLRSSSTPSSWRGPAYCHLNLRIDQITATEWDFRVFHWDAKWGWDWIEVFTHELASVIGDMVVAPCAALLDPPRPRAWRAAAERKRKNWQNESGQCTATVGYEVSGSAKVPRTTDTATQGAGEPF